MRCAVYGCNNNNKLRKKNRDDTQKRHQFFRFPKDKNLCKQWVTLTWRQDKFNTSSSRICEIHFTEDSFLLKSRLYYSAPTTRKLCPDAIPSLFLPKQSPPDNNRFSGTERSRKPETKRKCTKILNDECNSETNEVEDQDQEIVSATPEPNDAFDFVKSIFSKEQINKLKYPNKRPNWSVEDIANGISIHSAGPRAYRLLLEKGYPFPAVSTLRYWCKNIEIPPGILTNVLSIMKELKFHPVEKLTVLSFDKMAVKKQYLYDKGNDDTLRPSSYVQVGMARGLVGAWEQPFFYNYDCKITQSILFDCIKSLEDAGYHVIAIVSDLGVGNRGLYKAMNVTTDKPYFSHPSCPEDNIYVFADTPNLLILLWAHFLDNGFLIDGKQITKSVVLELFNLTSKSDLNVVHRLTSLHFTANSAQRHKVKLAAQFFSHSVSKAITKLAAEGKLSSENSLECANLIKTVNDWFDVLNVRVPHVDSPRMEAFGLALREQTQILNRMSKLIENMKVLGGRQAPLPFQKDILMTNNALQMLHCALNKKYGLDFILTYRLNQDVLENFFEVIRSKGGLHDHPTASEFLYRLRSYILGRNESSFANTGNTKIDETPNLMSLTSIDDEIMVPNASQSGKMAPSTVLLSHSAMKFLNVSYDEPDEEENDLFPDDLSDVEYEYEYATFKI